MWFATALSEPGTLGACPMHGGHDMPPAGMMMMHGAAHLASSNTGADTNEGRHQQVPDQCTCIGACCCGAVAAAPQQMAVLPREVVSESAAVADVSDAAPSGVQRPHSLPFANGPPQTRLS